LAKDVVHFVWMMRSSLLAFAATTLLLGFGTGCIRHSPEAASTPSLSPMTAPAATQVVFKTSQGEFVLELDTERAPITAANFLAYVDAGHFDGMIFHRVIPGFMVQGGGFDASMRERSTRAPIKNEANNGLKNARGTVAMARTQVVDSATAQFFVNLVDNTFLDHGSRDFGYAVFGKVVSGMDIVDAISRTPTGRRGGHSDVPVSPIVIESAKRR
jgi:peptidyl-prolyl cis-trans isomerase A (cyclophilin A)